MESLYFLIPGALIFIAIAIKILFWAVNSGQYDNLDTEAHRILFDDEKTKSVTQPQEILNTQNQEEQPLKEKEEQPKHE
jgi:cbb3-type cytochrome oxidase maturation protein